MNTCQRLLSEVLNHVENTGIIIETKQYGTVQRRFKQTSIPYLIHVESSSILSDIEEVLKSIYLGTSAENNRRFLEKEIAAWTVDPSIDARSVYPEYWGAPSFQTNRPSYAERIFYQFPFVLSALEEIGTRRALISIWESLDLTAEMYVPCTICYQFFREEDSVSGISIMRSVEVKKNLVNDLWLSIKLISIIAEKLKLRYKKFSFLLNNAHYVLS